MKLTRRGRGDSNPRPGGIQHYNKQCGIPFQPKTILKLLRMILKYQLGQLWPAGTLFVSPLIGRVYHILTDTADETPAFTSLTAPLTLPEYMAEVAP